MNSAEMNYTTVVALDETGAYLAWHPELVGCMSDGDTPGEAIANLSEAREMTLEHLRQHDLPVPPPLDWSKPISIDLGLYA